MSSPPQGRALALPFLRAGTSPGPVTVAEKVEIRGQSDEEAMARLQAQDSNALNLLFDRYAHLVLSIALRILRDYGEAEEIVQDVFFYMYRKSALFDPLRGSAKAWIVQIAFHRALDRKAHLSRRGFYLGTDIDPLHDTLLDHTDVEREIGAEMNRLHLEKAFEELPEVQRRTLDLFYFQGLELREISERLNEPLGNVRHHFYRGLEKLRKSALVRRLWERQSL
jgi:RNA polymerase sigma-70 factor (ECF subfamily)